MKPVRTRFAPSPTGYLHIGGARTALFSWAYAQQQGGQFFLRIEDTDAVRSDAAHSQAIIDAMDWLGITADAAPIFQSANLQRHQTIIQQLIDNGNAYYCYASPEELQALRQAQQARGENPKYDRRWRDSNDTPPAGVTPAVRFKMPLDSNSSFSDAVKGTLSVANSELDDFIIARADGVPTYNLAAVVDDIDMEITHVIRGDDHVMNTYRQWHLFQAIAAMENKAIPEFAHLPMIFTAAHAEDGTPLYDAEGNVRYARMSKRYAAVDIDIYRREGFLPAALCNYLARLSWGHGDAEVFARDFFVEHFSFAAISQSPARFDLAKLKWLNHEHLRALSPQELRQQAGIDNSVSDAAIALIRERGDTLNEIKTEAAYFENRPQDITLPAEHDMQAAPLNALYNALATLDDWQGSAIKECIKQTVAAQGLKFKHLGMPLRLALTGRAESPDIAAIAAILGQDETLQRLQLLRSALKN